MIFDSEEESEFFKKLRPRLTHVAIRFQGKIYSLPAPNRHHHVIRHIVETVEGVTHVDDISGENQGFLDAEGRYLTRKQALVSALVNDQVIDRTKIIGYQLYSENVW